MKRLLWFSLILIALPAWAGQARVEGIQVSSTPKQTRVVIDLSARVQHNLFTLAQPPRAVIDLGNTVLQKGVSHSASDQGVVEDVRTGVRHDKDLRIVLDLRSQAPVHSRLVGPSGSHGYRLILNLKGDKVSSHAVHTVSSSSRPIVIAVDPGHGGVDDGATGPDGLMEKTVTLDVARKLAAKINATHGMKAYLTRKGDYYVGLKKRIVEAHKAHADLFVSIHCNAVADASYVHGAAVYVLSRHGASSTHAKYLAHRENASEQLGGNQLDQKDRVLASVLLDMSQTASIEASMDVANRMLKDLKNLGSLYKSRPQRANFVVLRSPDIPSVLVETAFITNPHQERKLANAAYQGRVASEIMAGIKGYFQHYRPHHIALGTKTASNARRYKVHRGDTLSGIAANHHVSVSSLRAANSMNSDTIRTGDTLKIPTGDG